MSLDQVKESTQFQEIPTKPFYLQGTDPNYLCYESTPHTYRKHETIFLQKQLKNSSQMSPGQMNSEVMISPHYVHTSGKYSPQHQKDQTQPIKPLQLRNIISNGRYNSQENTISQRWRKNENQYSELQKLQQQLKDEGAAFKQQIMQTLGQSVEDSNEMRILGNQAAVQRRGSIDVSEGQRSYSQIMKMMKNIEEYGKNLEQNQQNLTQQDYQPPVALTSIKQAKTYEQNNQVNLIISGSNSSLAAAIAQHDQGQQAVFSSEDELIDHVLQFPIGDTNQIKMSSRNQNCLYDIDLAKYNKMMKQEIDKDIAHYSNNQATGRGSGEHLGEQNLNGPKLQDDPLLIVDNKRKNETEKANNHYKNCIGCQQIMMRQQLQYIQQQRKYIENLKKLTEISHMLKTQMSTKDNEKNIAMTTRDFQNLITELNKAKYQFQGRSDADSPFQRPKTVNKLQKYKIVGGKVYEAVHLTEHQFSGQIPMDQKPSTSNFSPTRNQTLTAINSVDNNNLNESSLLRVGCEVKVATVTLKEQEVPKVILGKVDLSSQITRKPEEKMTIEQQPRAPISFAQKKRPMTSKALNSVSKRNLALTNDGTTLQSQLVSSKHPYEPKSRKLTTQNRYKQSDHTQFSLLNSKTARNEMLSLESQNLMLLRSKNKPMLNNLSLGISGKQSRFNLKSHKLRKLKNPDMNLEDDYLHNKLKQEMVIIERKGSSQINNFQKSSRQDITMQHSALDEKVSRSSLRRQISLNKLDKQRNDELDDDYLENEATFVRDPLNFENQSPLTRKTEIANSGSLRKVTDTRNSFAVISKIPIHESPNFQSFPNPPMDQTLAKSTPVHILSPKSQNPPLALFENQYINTPQIYQDSESQRLVSTQKSIKRNLGNQQNKTKQLLNKYKINQRNKKVSLLKNIKSSKLPVYDSEFQINIEQSKQRRTLKKEIINEQLTYLNKNNMPLTQPVNPLNWGHSIQSNDIQAVLNHDYLQDMYIQQNKLFNSHLGANSNFTIPRQGTMEKGSATGDSVIRKPQLNLDKTVTVDQTSDQPVDFNLTYSMDKSPIEDLILSHITDAIVQPSNIAQILAQKNSLKLIRAADANYMNQTVFHKFGKTWQQREGLNTDTRKIVNSYRQKMHLLYQNAQQHFNILSQIDRERQKNISSTLKDNGDMQLSFVSNDPENMQLKPSKNFMNNLMEPSEAAEKISLKDGVASQTRHASKQETAPAADDLQQKQMEFNVEIKYKQNTPFFGKMVQRNKSNLPTEENQRPSSKQISNMRKYTSQNELISDNNINTQNSFGIVSPNVNSSIIMTVLGVDAQKSPESKKYGGSISSDQKQVSRQYQIEAEEVQVEESVMKNEYLKNSTHQSFKQL